MKKRVRKTGAFSFERWSLVIGTVLALLAAGSARAQEKKSEAVANGKAASGDRYTDVVMLRSGAVYHGRISELEPGDHVVLVTIAGDVKRFKMSEVSFAGAESYEGNDLPDVKPAAAAAGVVGPARLPLKFEAAEPDLTLHFLSRESQVSPALGIGNVYGVARTYERLCTAPCNLDLPPGSYQMALSKGQGRAVETDSMVAVEKPSTLKGRYRDNGDVRILGWGILGLGNGVGLALMLASGKDGEMDTGMMIAGCSVALTSTLLGLILGLIKDTATIERVD